MKGLVNDIPQSAKDVLYNGEIHYSAADGTVLYFKPHNLPDITLPTPDKYKIHIVKTGKKDEVEGNALNPPKALVEFTDSETKKLRIFFDEKIIGKFRRNVKYFWYPISFNGGCALVKSGETNVALIMPFRNRPHDIFEL